MAFATPYVENGILIYSIGTQWYTLSVESQDWQVWLREEGKIFRYEAETLRYTARLEERERIGTIGMHIVITAKKCTKSIWGDLKR